MWLDRFRKLKWRPLVQALVAEGRVVAEVQPNGRCKVSVAVQASTLSPPPPMQAPAGE